MIKSVQAIEINPTTFPVGGNISNIGQVVSFFTSSIIFVASIIFLGMLLYSGYEYTTSGGDTKVLTKVKSRIWYSILGIVLILTALLFTRLVGFISGMNLAL